MSSKTSFSLSIKLTLKRRVEGLTKDHGVSVAQVVMVVRAVAVLPRTTGQFISVIFYPEDELTQNWLASD